MRRILPIALVLLGLFGGLAAGWFLKPAPKAGSEEKKAGGASAPSQDKETDVDDESKPETAAVPEPGAAPDPKEKSDNKERSYVTIGKQTIVPVVEGRKTQALMLFELAVDVSVAAHDRAVSLEPRLRDVFLQELLKMASTGAFTNTYTENWVIDELRRNLSVAARAYLGDDLKDVLILDVIRQEM